MTPEILTRLAEEWIPFNRTLGLRALRVGRGEVLFEIPFRDDLIGDPMRRALHGGVLSMLADTAGGFAVWSALDDARTRISTIDLRVDYLLPGKPEALLAHATTARAGKTVGVADVRLYQASAPEQTIATGKGVYAIRLAKDARALGDAASEASRAASPSDD